MEDLIPGSLPEEDMEPGRIWDLGFSGITSRVLRFTYNILGTLGILVHFRHLSLTLPVVLIYEVIQTHH